ncbi:hypothetical protein SAMN05216302_10278 [Nitrosomonas aestuarii]|uniref:Uncharacterized protein n=1 Tax=Nitrosomonas aestuarii TaxID=52441 RepID=A0A1I4EAJ1_9PROT|nr:hypothetical protein [Nitrosomonas aestuarii]SFL02834.1 hypothetical protein SAMN05216302_10278 [Nitrosomonas aestuarii]
MLSWLDDQFNNKRLFRRLLVINCCALVWAATFWSFGYAYRDTSLPGFEIAAVITAIQAPITLLVGFCSKLYTVSIEKNN